LRPVFSASRVQHIADMHSKFALRRGKKKKKKERRKKPQLQYSLPITMGGHNTSKAGFLFFCEHTT